MVRAYKLGKIIVVGLVACLLVATGLVLYRGMRASAVGPYTISGVLADQANRPFPSARIYLENGSGNVAGQTTTDSSGAYSITPPPGVYRLHIIGSGSSLGLTMHTFSETQGSPTIDLNNGDVTLNLQVQLATVHVSVKDASGNPLASTQVSSSGHYDGTYTGSLYPGDPGEAVFPDSAGATDANGNLDLHTIVGTKYDTAQQSGSICATVSSAYVCLASPLTITGDTSVVLQQPQSHSFSGTLSDQNNTPVSNARIYLESSNGSVAGQTTTDASGAYSITPAPGVYRLHIIGSGGGLGLSTLSSFSESQNTPTIDLQNNDVALDLKVKIATVHVTVKDAAGNPLPGTPVSSRAHFSGTYQDSTLYPGDPGESVAADSYGTTGADGTVVIHTLAGINYSTTYDSGSLCATISGGYVCVPSATQVTGDTSIVLQPQPTTHTFSGTLIDQNNNPIASARIYLENASGQVAGQTITAADGAYNITPPPGVYRLHIIGTGTSLGLSQLTSFSEIQNTPTIDLSNSDLALNLKVQLTTVHVMVKDASGNPLSSIQVSSRAHFSGTYQDSTLYPSDPGESVAADSAGATDANGMVDLPTLVGINYGTTYEGGSLCAVINGGYFCVASPTTITGETTIVLQQAPPVPTAPQNLTAVTPTQQPVLTWSGAAFATSYTVYRDGVQVGTSATTTYTDTNAPEGPHAYYVTAVGSSGQSGPSNTIQVLVDRTLPQMTYSLSPPAINSWNNSNVTVTFSCSDNAAQIRTCTAPVTVTGEGANQAVTGTAVDNAGNTASVTAIVNLDKTKPTVSNLTLSGGPVYFSTTSVTISAAAADTLSGVSGGEYYIDTDPGQGQGTAMTFANGHISKTTNFVGLRPGRHIIFVRSKDVAGNWSTTVSTSFVFTF